MKEIIDLLVAYYVGWKTIQEVEEWLGGVDWDDSGTYPEGSRRIDSKAKELLGHIELLVTEVLEGMRPEAEFREEVARVVNKETGTLRDLSRLVPS